MKRGHLNGGFGSALSHFLIVQISFTGDAYWEYTIETSTDLVHWSMLMNLMSTNGLFQFADSATNSPQLFYRARVSP